jgi:AcrR family transcriptional regulator
MITYERRSTEVRRQEIVDEARRIVAARGFKALTMTALGRAVGVTDGALYRHFASKRDILLAVIDDIEETLFETLEREREPGGSPIETLRGVLQAHLSYAERRRGGTFVMMAEVLLNGDRQLRSRMRELMQRYLDLIEGLLEEGQQIGEVRAGIDREATARAFFGLIQGTITLWRLADSGSPSGRYEALWSIFAKGVAANSGALP